MHISEFIADGHKNQTAFASDLGQFLGKPIDQSAVSRWCNKKRLPDYETMKAIEAFTGGAVSLGDWERATSEAA